MSKRSGPRTGPVIVVPVPIDDDRVGPELPDFFPPVIDTVGRLSARKLPLLEKRITIAGEDAIYPEAFGRVMLTKPRIFAVAEVGNTVILGIFWCRGEIGSINGFYAGNEIYPGTVTHYLGTSGQGVDSTLAAAIAGYADTLTDLCYSVVTVDETLLRSNLNFSIDLQDRKLFDPRTSQTVGTANFALMYRYVATQAGLTVDNQSILDAADYGDEDVGGHPRWSGGLVFYKPVAIEKQLALIAEYAGCFHVSEGGTVKLVPDKATATTSTFSDEQTDIDAGAGMIVANSLRMTKKALDQIPNQVSVQFLDPSKVPWRNASASTPSPPGDIRKTTFRMTGYRDFNTAFRFATERQNRFNLVDLELQFTAFDEALSVETGDVTEVTHSVGLIDKKIRVLDVRASSEIGHWEIIGEEYDPAINSDTVSNEPTYPDIGLPDPGDVPVGPSATVKEVLFPDQTGHTYTRFEIKFNGVTWPFAASYRIKVSDGTDIILEQNIAHLGTGLEHISVTSATSQDVEYTIEIWIINIFGKISATPSSTTQTGDGNIIPPTDVTNLTGRETGQFVTLQWDDVIDSDLRGYVIRRLDDTNYEADPGAAWDHASTVTIIERVDSSLITKAAEPVGIWYYMVKGKDLAGNLSINAAAIRIDVTADFGGAIAIQELDDDGSLLNMHKYELHGSNGGDFVVTSSGRTWAAIFGAPGTTWDAVLSAGQRWGVTENVPSRIITVEWDVGSDRNGNWIWSANIIVFQGTIVYTTKLATASAYPTFTDHSGQSVNADARYLKAKTNVAAALGNGFRLKLPVLATHQGRILEQEITTVMTTTQPEAIVYPESYAGVPKVTPKYEGPNPFFAVADNVTVTGFDLYLYKSSDGTKQAGTVETDVVGT